MIDDHLLNEAARIVGNTAIIPDRDLNLPAGDSVAVLLHVKLQRGLQLAAHRIEAGPGERHADSDLERRLRGRAAGEERGRSGRPSSP